MQTGPAGRERGGFLWPGKWKFPSISCATGESRKAHVKGESRKSELLERVKCPRQRLFFGKAERIEWKERVGEARRTRDDAPRPSWESHLILIRGRSGGEKNKERAAERAAPVLVGATTDVQLPARPFDRCHTHARARTRTHAHARTQLHRCRRRGRVPAATTRPRPRHRRRQSGGCALRIIPDPRGRESLSTAPGKQRRARPVDRAQASCFCAAPTRATTTMVASHSNATRLSSNS